VEEGTVGELNIEDEAEYSSLSTVLARSVLSLLLWTINDDFE